MWVKVELRSRVLSQPYRTEVIANSLDLPQSVDTDDGMSECDPTIKRSLMVWQTGDNWQSGFPWMLLGAHAVMGEPGVLEADDIDFCGHPATG